MKVRKAYFGVIAVLAVGFFAAVGVRSVVAGPGSAPPAAPPNPGHGWEQIELPLGTWPGLDADTVDGMDAGELGGHWTQSGNQLYADDTNWNVGIGTTNPSHELTIESPDDRTLRLIGPDGTWGYGARLNFGDDDYVYIEEDTDDDLYIRADRTAIMGGPVGIGTTSPAQTLHVAGGARFDLGGGRVEMSTPGGWPGIIAYVPGGNRRDISFDATGIRLLTSSSGGPAGAANGITIDESGRVGIGTNSPSARLEASGTSGDLLRLTNPGSPTGPTVFRVDSSGQVFADASYNCGLSSTSACLQAGQGADIAERMDVSGPVEPGDVIEVDPDHPGKFRKTRSAYSSLVVGIVSDAPAITLGNQFDPTLDIWEDHRPLLALAGKVPVKVTADNGPIGVGDLLVSSNGPGYAMRCPDWEACAGAIVGKALEPLERGSGLIYASVLVH